MRHRRLQLATLFVLALAAAFLTADAVGRGGGARDYPVAPASELIGRIVYSTGRGDIWVMNANGTCRHQVTQSGSKTDYDPSWSPDGRRVVFSTDRGRSHSDATRAGLDSMFVINVEGSREREIEPRSGAVFPEWSPKGDRIAFSGLRATGQETTIYTIRPDGSGLIDLGLGGAASEPIWSPDGTQIAYSAHGGGSAGIWVVSAEGGMPRRLTQRENDSPGAWSPDGRQLAYSSGESGQAEAYVIDVAGGTPQQVTHWPSNNVQAWLPNGRIVLVHFNGDQPQAHFYLVNPDGSDIRSLPKLKAGAPLSWLPRKAPDRACGRRSAPPPKRKAPRPTLRSFVAPLVRGRHRPPGAVAYVLDHRRGTVKAVGFAKLESHARMTAGTRFRIASVTKSFTATLVLQLVGERKLRLTDSVEQWLPGLLPSGSQIAVRELLNHTSGIYDYVRDPSVRATWGTDSVPPPRALIAIAASHGLDFAPGSSWRYSNTNYQVLGLLVERVTGHSLAAELRSRIFRPLHLRHTALVPGRDIPGPHANGYYVYTDGQATMNVTRTTFGAWADGAIVSSVYDLGRFFSALLGGKLLRPGLLAEMKRTVSTGGSGDGEESGLGIFRFATSCGRRWGNSGGTAGFLTKILASADGSRVAVFATNGLVDEGPITQPRLDAAAAGAFCSTIGRGKRP